MTTSESTSKYAVTLSELERSVQVPVDEQVTTQSGTIHEPAISEWQLKMTRLLGIEHAG